VAWTCSGGRSGPKAWVKRSETSATRAGLERFRQQYLKGFWADLEDLNIETILEQRGEDPVKFIERLKQNSSPLISINEVAYKEQQAEGEPIEPRRELILGAPFGKNRFFQEFSCPNGFEIVATGEAGQHCIQLLNSVFYVSLLALTQSESYRNAYQRLTAAGHNLHIFDRAELGLDQPEVS